MQQNLAQQYKTLYDFMAQSNEPKHMKAFGKVMNDMMDWFIANRPSDAEEWIMQLEGIRWKNYLTPSEAEKVVAAMTPKAPWTKEQLEAAMKQHGYEMEEWPYYNKCSLWVVMNMLMSDSGETLKKYVGQGDIFEVAHALAVDKLKDADGRFRVREYFL